MLCDSLHAWFLTQSRLITMLPSLIDAGGSGVRLHDGPDIKLFILVGWGRSLSVAWPTGVQLVVFFCSGVSMLLGAQGSPSSGSLLILCPRI